MSIDENQGGLYKGLKELRDTNGESPNNIFKFMGLDYKYVADGNDLQTMIDTFKEIKDIEHPIVLHVNTLKGKGYEPAVEEKMKYHWRTPFDLKTGEDKVKVNGESYSDAVLAELDKQIAADKPVVAINAGIPGAFNLGKFKAK